MSTVGSVCATAVGVSTLACCQHVHDAASKYNFHAESENDHNHAFYALENLISVTCGHARLHKYTRDGCKYHYAEHGTAKRIKGVKSGE